jgi:uncharacterized protein (DUF1697 family)
MMVRCVALMRGINVGGHNRVAMADLRALCEDLGHRDVATYVQSGNVVLTTDRDDLVAVGTELTGRMRSDLGIAPTVMVRAADDLAAVAAANPFPAEAAADPSTVHAAFLSAEPEDPSTLSFDAADYAPERIEPGDRVRYLLLPKGIGRSQLATDLARRRSEVDITVRNWRTVTKLLALVGR